MKALPHPRCMLIMTRANSQSLSSNITLLVMIKTSCFKKKTNSLLKNISKRRENMCPLSFYCCCNQIVSLSWNTGPLTNLLVFCAFFIQCTTTSSLWSLNFWGWEGKVTVPHLSSWRFSLRGEPWTRQGEKTCSHELGLHNKVRVTAPFYTHDNEGVFRLKIVHRHICEVQTSRTILSD